VDINYFGKPYSFTHIAALKRFGIKHRFFPHPTVLETVEAALNKPNSISVVPIENTTGGIIPDVVDALIMHCKDYLNISEELELTIRLFLASKHPIKLSQVKKIYSHEYPLKRSEEWIKKYLPGNVILKCAASTSDAAYKIQKEKSSCAIISEKALKHYGLKKLSEIKVEGKPNLTKFFVIKKKRSPKYIV